MRLCDCGCGLATRNAESDAHPGHEERVKAMRLAEHRAISCQHRAAGPKVNGKAERRRRAKERKAQGAA